jgi:hypothetical protein
MVGHPGTEKLLSKNGFLKLTQLRLVETTTECNRSLIVRFAAYLVFLVVALAFFLLVVFGQLVFVEVFELGHHGLAKDRRQTPHRQFMESLKQ